MAKPSRPETFNDGLCTISTVTNDAQPGKKPVEKLTPRYVGLRYRERTVGIARYYTAAQANVRVDRVIRVARLRDVTTRDKATTEDGVTYYIRQVQYPEGVEPPVMDLSLERVISTDDQSGLCGADCAAGDAGRRGYRVGRSG